MNKNDRRSAEDCADGYFTEEEIKVLENFLKRRDGYDLIVEKQTLPLQFSGPSINYEQWRDECINRELVKIYSEDHEHGLPFYVGAFFDLHNCPVAFEVQKKERELGVRFLKEVFDSLKIDVDMDENQIDSLVAEIYENRKYFVVNKNEVYLRPVDDIPF